HANLDIDTPLLRWVVTNANQHRRHHSLVFDQSNTNYACNAILWDRLFGTHSEGPVEQTGLGPREPGLLEKLLRPIREPDYSDTAASRRGPGQGGPARTLRRPSRCRSPGRTSLPRRPSPGRG